MGLEGIQIISPETSLKMVFGIVIFLILFLLIFSPYIFIPAIKNRFNHLRLKDAGLLDTDTMTGIEFEKWLKHQLEQIGYRVKTTPRTGDGGADLILTGLNDERIAVQAKKLASSKRKIGVKAVEEVLRGKMVHNCDKAIVITNQYFGTQAIRDAKKCGVELWDRNQLLEQIEINKKVKQKMSRKKTG